MSFPQISQHLYGREPVLTYTLITAGRMRSESGIDAATLALHEARPDLVRDPSDSSQYQRLTDDCAARYGSAN
jgi:hypothetical protein